MRSDQRSDAAAEPPGLHKRPERSCLRGGFRITKASPQLLEMLQAYARLPLRPTVSRASVHGLCVTRYFATM